MRTLALVIDDIRGCAASENNQPLQGLFQELEIQTVTLDTCPPGPFRTLISLFHERAFLELDDSWRLPRFVANNWPLFSAEQRQQLRPVLERSFDKFHDWMGAFIIAELFGEGYADQAALDTLTILATTAQLPARVLTVRGFEALARIRGEGGLRDAAVEQLRHLTNSELPEMRDEASRALRGLNMR